MPLTVTITPGYAYPSIDSTVTQENLNKLGTPTAQVADGLAADFASVVIAAGSAAAPTLKGKDALLSGFFFDALEVGVAVNGQECVRFTADGLELDDGRAFVGNLIATAGSETEPSISFAGKTGTGLWLSGSAIAMSVDGDQVVAISDSTFGILAAAFDAKAGTFSGNLAVGGNLTVTGTISGVIDKVGAGTVSAPGLAFATDTSTGIYRPAASASTNRFGQACGATVALIHNADTGVAAYTYLGNSATDTDWPLLGLAQLIIDAPGGRAPINFAGDSEYSSSGSGAANISNLPTGAILIPRWSKARLNNSKVLIPCFPFEW